MNDDNDIDAYIERLVAGAPPLSDEQITRLAAVLQPPARMEGVA